jgi:hypothetical protein
MINGTEYGWEDIQVILPGNTSPIDGVTAISYKGTKKHENIFGRGNKAVALGRGQEEYSGSFTLLQSVVEAIQRTLPPGKSLIHLPPFNIVVSYAPENGVITTDTLLQCRVKEMEKGMKSGDTHMEVKMDLAIGDIQYNS